MAVERVALAVDVACFALREDGLELLLVRRGAEPFAGLWALPGGVVGADEPLDAAAARVLAERTGVWGAYLEQLYTFGEPGRDPRGRTVSVAYYALLPGEPAAPRRPRRRRRRLAPGRRASAARLRPRPHRRVRPLAARAEGRLHARSPSTSCPKRSPWATCAASTRRSTGERFDPSNFQRQMLARWDLAPVPGVRDRRTRRPARLYRYIGPRQIPGPPSGDPEA